mgnify:CR=1 FL=1
MKKKLLALAVAGAFVAPVAMADTGNVTVYGQMNAAYSSVDSGSTSTTSSQSVSRISSDSSRIGFKGTEDLGGGLNVGHAALDRLPQFHLFDEQPGHDGLAGARVVGQHVAAPRGARDGKRIDAGVEGRVRVQDVRHPVHGGVAAQRGGLLLVVEIQLERRLEHEARRGRKDRSWPPGPLVAGNWDQHRPECSGA